MWIMPRAASIVQSVRLLSALAYTELSVLQPDVERTYAHLRVSLGA